MNISHRYQYGSLPRRKRIQTENVGQFRYYETTPEGQRRRRSKIIGTLSQYPTPKDTLRILERFRLRLSLQNRLGPPVTLDALAEDYVEKELCWGGCLSVVGGEVKGKPAEPFASCASAWTAVGDNRR